MAYKPVEIFIGGQQLEGYTGMTLSRSKEELTGSLNVDIFFNYMPTEPVLVDVGVAKEIVVYIGGNIAFRGNIDKRNGTSAQGKRDSDGRLRDEQGRFTSEGGSLGDGDGSISSSIGANEYSVTLSARGKAKYLVDSSHQYNKNLLKTSTRKVVDTLLEPFNIQTEWLGTDIDLDKVRLRDGSKVIEELRRVAIENGYYIYETADGKLRITDDIGPGIGEALILGENILAFSAEQTEESAKSEITVKGQRTGRDVWGEDAVLNGTTAIVKDKWVQSYIPITVQHYGDATKEALERRARFEANKRSSRSKTLTVEVFHVQARNGEPWDVGTLHYVEVPPEGIFDTFECTAVNYTVTNDETLKTTLTLSPPPKGGSASVGGLESFESAAGEINGAARKRQFGVTFAAGSYPQPWSGPVLAVQAISAAAGILLALQGVTGLAKLVGDADNSEDNPEPPKRLPRTFDDANGTGGNR